MSSPSLPQGPLGDACRHLCVDMQLLFAEGSEWAFPWMQRVLPRVEALVRAHAEATIFTRFIPARRPGEGTGTWRRYYERWAAMTIDHIGESMLDLVPELARHVPPARVLDKRVYSPWIGGRLDPLLRQSGVDTLVVTGGETDVCVLATVLGAVDRGYRVVVVTDAVCSSSDESHDALIELYRRRYTQQVETADSGTVLAQWP
jgi:nicotinamidase-related amidase